MNKLCDCDNCQQRRTIDRQQRELEAWMRFAKCLGDELRANGGNLSYATRLQLKELDDKWSGLNDGLGCPAAG